MRAIPGSLRRAALLALLILACLAPGADATPLAWSVPGTTFDHRPHGTWLTLTAASCPTSTFCVAVDGDGTLLTSTDPAGGPDAWSWRKLPIPARDIACPSTTLCVAVGLGGIVTTRDPVGGPWTVTALGERAPAAIECPAPTLCVAHDTTYGAVWTATDPAGGAAAWTMRTVPLQLRSLSCPTTTLCVGTGSGSIVTSTNPTGDAGAWPSFRLEGLEGEAGVTCGSPQLCLLAGTGGTLATTTDPTGGASAWTLSRLDPANDHQVVCASSRLCFAAEFGNGFFYTSTDPAAGAFNRERLDARVLACAGTDLCLAVPRGRGGVVLTSSAPADGVRSWLPTDLSDLGAHAPRGAACPSPTRCLIVDDVARVFTSDTPAASWREEADLTALGAEALTAIACAPSRCVAGDAAGALFTRDPSGAWRTSDAATGSAVRGVACPSDALCVAVDHAGLARRTLAGGDWSRERVTYAPLHGVACPSAALCLAVGEEGRVFSSDGSAWRSTRVARSGERLLSLACPTAGFCVAGTDDGAVFFSESPTANRDWVKRDLYGGESITAVACPSTSLCVAVDDDGGLHTTAEPATGAPWERLSLFGPLTAVTCAGDALCLAVDVGGYAFTGTGRGVPYSTAAPTLPPTVRLGETLRCDPGQWTGAPALSYQWTWDHMPIPEATGPTFTLRDRDEGHRLACQVIAVNARGRAVATSGATTVHTPPLPVGELALFGTAEDGYSLRCEQRFTGTPGMQVTYAWTRDGLTIGNWPFSHMVFGPGDVGHTYTCSATATSESGTHTVTSPVLTVAARPPVPFPFPPPAFSAQITPKATRLAALVRRGLPVTVRCSADCAVTVRLVPNAATAKRLGLRRGAAFGTVTIKAKGGRATAARVKLSRAAQRAIKRKRVRSVRFTVRAAEAAKRPVSGAKTLTSRR